MDDKIEVFLLSAVASIIVWVISVLLILGITTCEKRDFYKEVLKTCGEPYKQQEEKL